MIDVRYFYFIIPLFIIFFILLVLIQERRIDKERIAIEKKIKALKMGENRKDTYVEEIRKLVKNIQDSLDKPEELSSLSEQCSCFTGKMQTGIPVMDALLSYKKVIAEQKGISVEYGLCPVESEIMPEQDMISLVGNLLDNAIEGAEKSVEGWIKMECRRVKGKFILLLTNSKSRDIYVTTENMETTKEDRENHGLGIKIIHKILKRNKGYMKIRDHGDFFEVYIALTDLGE